MELTGRHAVVCGASQGIGRAVAEALGRRGATLTLVARRPDRLALAVEELRGQGVDVAAWVQDLADTTGLARGAEALLGGRGDVSILVHNTGGPPGGALLGADPGELSAAFAAHVLSAHVLARAFVPGMRRGGWGRIVHVVSTSVREPIDGLGVSNTVRGALASWAKSLSRELPVGVTVNNVLPGYTDTERLAALAATTASRLDLTTDEVRRRWAEAVPEGRIARSEEIAEVVAFLCSPAASYVRGVSVPVDGGRLRSI